MHGMIWSFIDNSSRQLLNFLIGIILARLLSPREFGLVGMLTVFIAVSNSFIDSGFSSALIRKKDAGDRDFNTVFYTNMTFAVVIYIIIFLSSGLIARFMNEPELELLVCVLALNLLIGSVTLIQTVILTRDVDFKKQSKVSIVSTVVSGIVAIAMAYYGYGVWSLVLRTLLAGITTSVLLWCLSNWRPKLLFCTIAFKELFSFGSKVMISGLINTLYTNVNKLIIGKYYTSTELGFYNSAETFKKMPAENLTSVIQRVSYPVLSQLQNDATALRRAYKNLIAVTMLISFSVMFCLGAMSDALIITVLGEKWARSGELLLLMSIGGALYPLHAINLNILNVKGRSDLFLKLEVIKKLIGIPVIIIGAIYGVKALIIAGIILSIFAYFLNSYYSADLIGYPVKEQLLDIMPAFLISMTTAIPVWILGYWLHNHTNLSQIIILTIQIFFSITCILSLAELTNYKSYNMIKEILLARIIKK